MEVQDAVVDEGVVVRIGPVRPCGLSSAESEDGFSLIEVVVALTLTVIVMTATAGFFVKSLAASRLMQQRQGAVAAAAQAMERVRAEPITQLTHGRDTTVTGATDPAYRVANINYTVRTTINECWLDTATGVCGPGAAPSMRMFRATVNVQWTPRAGATCAGGNVCQYAVSTLRDPAGSSASSIKEVPR